MMHKILELFSVLGKNMLKLHLFFSGCCKWPKRKCGKLVITSDYTMDNESPVQGILLVS